MKFQNILTKLFVLLAGLISISVIVLFFYVAELSQDLPTNEQLENLDSDRLQLASEVFDRHGLKIGEIAEQRRYYVPLKNIPEHVKQSFLAIEDTDFYSHFGISIRSILRAGLTNLFKGKIKEGASTITQQVVRVYFLSSERSWSRKVKEVILAVMVDFKYSKNQILELYLNKIFFGNHSYGIEAASRNYFRKSVRDLNVGEAALLAGLPKAPSRFAPNKHFERAKKRQKVVLQRMRDLGFISSAEFQNWQKRKIKVEPKSERFYSRAPYVMDAVRNELSRTFDLQKLSVSGLKIHTTIDLDLQISMANTLMRGVRNIQKTSGIKSTPEGELQGAMVSINPHTGGIYAMQGGKNYNENEFNRSENTKRRLGPMYLPFYSAMALERGYTLQTLSDRSKDMKSKRRSLSIYEMLINSDVYEGAKLYSALGMGNIQQYDEKLGFKFKRDDLMLSLGYGESSVIELASAYSALANAGVRNKPYLIQKVLDNKGVVVRNHELKPIKVFSDSTSYIINFAMKDSVKFGNSTQLSGIFTNLAGYTGVTDDLQNSWVVSSLPKIISVSWIGAEKGQIKVGPDTKEISIRHGEIVKNFDRKLSQDYLRHQDVLPKESPIAFSRLPQSFNISRSLPFVIGTSAL